MLLLKKKSSKREKIHGAWPYLKTVIDHDDAVASNTECVVLVWAQIKFVSPLWQKLKLESTPLERLDSFGSNFPPHPGTFQILHSRSAFCVKFPTPWVRTTVKYPKVAGEGRGMSPLRVERRILQTLNTVRGLYNYHKFCQRPAAYYTKKRVSRWPSKPTYPSIGAREGFKLFYVVPRKISKALVSLSCQCV